MKKADIGALENPDSLSRTTMHIPSLPFSYIRVFADIIIRVAPATPSASSAALEIHRLRHIQVDY